ncbi:hypothetical protein R3W88_017512 [Solanum pinnatisectum]|uniref:Uncharacterized protein n=1 Tax=Solanum pinnatisectum TaxID=50273 RepID=A0AAV9L0V3_9SOLN|nr:hypothetical protein R3W88_017512 [Solanum pinnatisectum]
MKLTKWRDLSLTDVFLEERTILEISSACPAVEDLHLIRCQGVQDLLISDLPKLLKLTIHQPDEIGWEYRSIRIQVVNLQSLYYRGCNIQLTFDVTNFKFLKELSITFVQITDPIVENIVSELPLLEKLELNFCFKLTFRSGKSLMEIGIDTPNLLRFEYEAPKLPVISSMTTSCLQECYLKLMPNDHLSTMEELNGTLSCPPSIVKHVKIEQVLESLNFETLLDGLFWIFHPFLREKLMQREIVPVCCDSRRFKCWRYCLKLKLRTPLHGMGILLHHLKPRPFVSN